MTKEILALVEERSGMVFAPNRLVEVEAGIARSMRRAGADDLAAYLMLVRGDGIALDDLVDDLTVGETHFMRDPDQLDLVRRELLPALDRCRGGGAAPRVWSAGCATGEEAYSLAILIEEEGLGDGAVVLGTDLSRAALEKARVASYSDWSMRGVSGQFLQDNFRRAGGRRILADRIRNMVRFERLNLVGPEDYAAAGAFGMDVILCRNVLIYFGRETAGRIAARLYDCLAEGGVLLTAGADLRLGEYAPFEVEVTRVGLVYRRPCPIPRVGRPAKVAPVEPPRPRLPLDFARPVEDRAEPAPPKVLSRAELDPRREAFEQVTILANGMGAFEAQVMAQALLRRSLPL